MATDYVTDALTRMSGTTRRALLVVAENKVRDDPGNLDELTPLWWAIHNTAIDVIQAEADLIAQLEEDLRR